MLNTKSEEPLRQYDNAPKAVVPESVKLSRVLDEALKRDTDGPITVGEMADRVAERGFGLLLLLLSLPMLIPMPPGTAGPVGLLFALLGLQMLWGMARPWLPRRVRSYRLSPKVIKAFQKHGVAFVKRIEHLSKPRWSFLEHPSIRRGVALVIVVIGIILFLPLPFLNTLPSVMILCIAFGILNRDGVFLLVGTLAGIGLILFLLFGAHTLTDLLAELRAWLM